MPFRAETYDLANKVEECEIWERAYEHIEGGGGKSVFVYTSGTGVSKTEALRLAHALRQRLYNYRRALKVQAEDEWEKFRLYNLSIVNNEKYIGVRIGDIPSIEALRIVGE